MSHSEPSTHSHIAVARTASSIGARVYSTKRFHNSAVADRHTHTETVASCLPHVTSRRDHQRVPHSFRQQPTSSSHPEICQRAPLVQQTRNLQDTIFNSAPLPCLPCICSVSCAQLSFTLEPDNGLRNTHDECVSGKITSEVTKVPLAELRRLLVTESKSLEYMERKDGKKTVKCEER